MLLKTVPLPSTAANSGLPGRGMVATTFCVAASMTVASVAAAVEGPDGLGGRLKDDAVGVGSGGMVATVARVARSKTTTALPPPSEM
jgi:hypothetical protein